MKVINEEMTVAYDIWGKELSAERLQRWAYNQLEIAPKLLEALQISTATLEVVFEKDSENIAAKCCIDRNRALIL